MRRPGLALLLALAGAGCGRSGKPPPQRPPVPVVVAQASPRTVPVFVDAVGTVQPVNTALVMPRVSGTLLSVHFREGDEVAEGDLLFRIDPRPFELALRQARAALARDRVQARNARIERERYARLAGPGLVSREEAEARAAADEALQAALAADLAAVESAQLNLDYARVRAPIAGRTGLLQVTRGNLVKADDTARPLVVLRQLAPIDVSFAVPGQRLDEIRRRDAEGALRVLVEGGHAGTLRFVDNTVDPATGTLTLRARFANEDRALWPGQFVSVRLQLGELPDAVVVPAQALQADQQGGESVFVVRPDQTVEARAVKAGPRLDDGRTAILFGLRAGEGVVVDGQFSLVPGARVLPRPAGAPPPPSGPGVGGTGR